MFGMSAGSSAYPTVYSVHTTKTTSKKSTHSLPKVIPTSVDSLQPAIDGPPSPERIRAYTEQMKRSSIFGYSSRTNTSTSASSSFRSRDSVSGDSLSLSRKSSARSNSSRMPSPRSERPDSVQIFSSIFSRSGRKGKKGGKAALATMGEGILEEGSVMDRYFGMGDSSRHGTMTSIMRPQLDMASKKALISEPYNFQHVTHTRQDHLPNLEQSSRTELVSEFSAIRASQAPSKGELKGIRAEDLHFENFSSEALAPTPEEDESPPALAPKSPRRQHSVRQKSLAPPPFPAALQTKSHDNLGSPPSRPPRSPLSPTCPLTLPARTSSRTASVLFDHSDPLATTSIERPQTASGTFRRPSPFGLRTTPLPLLPTWSEQQEYFSDRPMSHALTTPGDEAWPLPTQTLGGDLADVMEEDEDIAPKAARLSWAPSELRMSQSVPALRLKAREQDQPERSESQISTIVDRPSSKGSTILRRSPIVLELDVNRDSWEDDVDFCYENEIEADCDYQWDRYSIGGEGIKSASFANPEQQQLGLHLEDGDRSIYRGRFRPSLLVPSALDFPELSPISNTSTPSSDPRTPSNFLRSQLVRSPSHASSFKESHGFTLSPTLLIPTDFQAQMDQDSLYEEQYTSDATAGLIFPPEKYGHAVSPVDDNASSTASYRSSGYSRGSARSSSSTRISSSQSQDSVILFSLAANINQAHRSIGSASSLPDLIPSSLRKAGSQEADLSASMIALQVSEDTFDSAPAPEISGPAATLVSVQHRRNRSLVGESGLRKGSNHFAPPTIHTEGLEVKSLSPVAESFMDTSKDKHMKEQLALTHERNSSAPLVGAGTREFKGRARAATLGGVAKKGRSSYMLFPQT